MKVTRISITKILNEIPAALNATLRKPTKTKQHLTNHNNYGFIAKYVALEANGAL
jgi:hypothetical protein